MKKRVRRIATGAGLGVTAALGASASAHGAAFTVNDGGDAGDGTCNTAPNDCTLRDALAAAANNNNSGIVDRILFASSVTGTITLNGTQLPTIDEPLYIDGPGAGTLTVAAGDASRILTVFPLGSAGAEVTVSGLTLAGGNAGPQGYGGAIDSMDANLTIRNSTISGNSAHGGGAIASRNGKYGDTSIEIEDSTISRNRAREGGGGLFVGGASDATIRNSTISHNGTGGDGGGIESHGSIAIENSTISGNSARGDGGGLYSTDVTAIRDSTISGNSAGNDGGGAFAVRNNPSVVNTILANRSAGGIGRELASPGGTFRVAFSLIAHPTGAPINTTVAGSNITGVDPQLGALRDNGGPTRTQALPPGSPAVDAGSSPRASDQRGMPRPVDQPNPDSPAAGANSADIGAFELQAPPPPAPIIADTRAPILELSGDKKQHSKSRVRVDARCDEACSVDATGTIKVPKSKQRKKFDLLEDSVELGAGETATLVLKFKGKAKKLVTKAFKNQKKSTAKVSATAADAAGNVSADDRKLKVKKAKKK